MKQNQVIRKLEKQVQVKREKLEAEIRSLVRQKGDRHYDPKAVARSKRIEIDRLNRRTISGLTYKIRDNYFSNARGTCGFNPETMHGHSYSWYSLVEKIKCRVILNTYIYSRQTSIHIGRVAKVLRHLGIKYDRLEAPRGLQDLDSALKHELNKQAELIVREKYARKKSNRRVKSLIRESEKKVKLLEILGKRATKSMREQALSYAESYRKSRNERLRIKRAEKKAMDALIVVVDSKNTMHEETGYHVISQRACDWNDNGEFVGRISDYEKRSAVSKGFTRLILHSKEPRHLSIVGGDK